MVNKTRSKGFAALIAAQSLADLDICDPALKKQIIQNCNTLIIQRQNDSEDAEELARIIGTEETWMMTSPGKQRREYRYSALSGLSRSS